VIYDWIYSNNGELNNKFEDEKYVWRKKLQISASSQNSFWRQKQLYFRTFKHVKLILRIKNHICPSKIIQTCI